MEIPLWTPATTDDHTTHVHAHIKAMSPRYYSGIGSRQTPLETLAFMRFLAITIAKEGWTLRSGGAEGADSAFQEGCEDVGGIRAIYLPWDNYNGHKYNAKNKIFSGNTPAARKIAAKHHPAWERMGEGSRKLHARNSHIVLGGDLKTPSEFVVCWTPNGSGQGGTGQAIRIADAYEIPVYDLGRDGYEIDPETIADLEIDFFSETDLLLEFQEWRSN